MWHARHPEYYGSLRTLWAIKRSALIKSRRRVRNRSRERRAAQSRAYLNGGRDAQALRFEGSIGRRTVGVHGVIKGFAAADCFGVGIEEACSGQLCSVEARFPMLGTAVFACELEGLPRSTVDLGRLKLCRGGKDGGNPSQLVPAEGIEPPTFSLQNCCSTAELSRRIGNDLRARIADLARQSQNQGLNRAGEKRSRPRVGPTAKRRPARLLRRRPNQLSYWQGCRRPSLPRNRVPGVQTKPFCRAYSAPPIGARA